MNNLRKILNNNNLKIKSLKYQGKVVILETDKRMLVYKDNVNNYRIYEYLKNRGFKYFPKSYNTKNSNYEIREYIDSKEVPTEEKLVDLIRICGVLHHSTSFKKEIDSNKIKEIYENILEEANYLRSYYEDLNNYIDTIVFMSPSEYLLVSNIDKIYYLISFVQVEITNWYNLVNAKKNMRYSLIHNNLSLEHIIENESKYLISWRYAKFDMPIFDLIKIYRDNYYDISLEDLIKEYEKENKLEDYEYLFFLIKLALPKRIEFTTNTLEDTSRINNYLIYLGKIAFLIQKSREKLKNI